MKDTGIGMDKPTVDSLFLPWAQKIGLTTNGSGLGLSISQRLAKIMGGDITAISSLGQGSEFSFSLVTTALKDTPVVLSLEMEEIRVDEAEEERTEAEEDSKQSHHHGAPRILVVDDNTINAKILGRMLTTIQIQTPQYPAWDVVTTDNGIEAIGQVEHHVGEESEFRLLVLDQNMPMLSGLQTAEYLRSRGYTPSRLDIVMVTGDSHIPPAKVQELQLLKVLLKPVNRSQLQTVLCHVKSDVYATGK